MPLKLVKVSIVEDVVVEAEPTEPLVLVEISDGRSVKLPVEWVLDNDSKMRHATGQKVTDVFNTYPTFSGLPSIASAELRSLELNSDDENVQQLRAKWDKAPFLAQEVIVTLSDQSTSTLRGEDLVKYAARVPLRSTPTSTFAVEHPKVDQHVAHVNFEDFVSTTKSSRFYPETLLALARDGLVIVDQCPNSMDAVVELARRIDVEQTTLYGSSWTVQTAPSEGPKNNVAFTSEFLDFHHDLVYYQSPPGLQLLHCLQFDDSVQGGESIFLDAFLIAEELRKRDPESFKALCEIPAAFMKDDMERAKPAQFYYATPHIHLNHEGTITEMRWAPAFEAPLPVADPAVCRRYYRARAAFMAVLTELRESRTLRFRLQPGQCVIFQQTRVLHGRERFTETQPHSRVLRGCYVNIDAFWNQVAVEYTNQEAGTTCTIPRGNRSFV